MRVLGCSMCCCFTGFFGGNDTQYQMSNPLILLALPRIECIFHINMESLFLYSWIIDEILKIWGPHLSKTYFTGTAFDIFIIRLHLAWRIIVRYRRYLGKKKTFVAGHILKAWSLVATSIYQFEATKSSNSEYSCSWNCCCGSFFVVVHFGFMCG